MDLPMISRPIPSTNEQLPVIGLGTWKQFDVQGADEKQNLVEVLRVMQKNKMRVIDSSPMYGLSEEVVGEVSQQAEKPDDFFYATKVWTEGETAGIKQM